MNNISFILAFFFMITGCDSANKSSSAPAQPLPLQNQFGSSGYELRNGNCYSSSTGQQVTNTFCNTNNSTIGYELRNGNCYSSSTGQQVANTFCSTNNSTTGYELRNGNCFSRTTGQQVANTFCSTNNSTTGYELRNGNCYSSSTGQQVDFNYCNAGSGNNNGSPINAGQCYGTFIYSQYGYSQIVFCYGVNCRGYFLTQPSSGIPVLCQ